MQPNEREVASAQDVVPDLLGFGRGDGEQRFALGRRQQFPSRHGLPCRCLGRLLWSITKDCCHSGNSFRPPWETRPFESAILEGFLAIARKSPATASFKVGLYARVSTHDQQTLPMQLSAMRTYAKRRGWKVAQT
jgi:hypothetical protein